MKRIITTFVALAIICTMSIPASATKSNVAGYLYSTDIRAFINGVEVPSYNIGGKTVVVIEDILMEESNQYLYDDASRSLALFSLNPSYLVEDKGANNHKPGNIAGRIYETDIKMRIYDVVIPTYNIGTKTAVAIEDLGCDGDFSPFGGRYFWNEEKRTISLEFLYSTPGIISDDKCIKISANQTMTEAQATFEEVFHCGGGQTEYIFPEKALCGDHVRIIMPIKANNEVLGYYFYSSLPNDNFTAFTYYYPEKVKEAEKDYIKTPVKTREEIIGHFVDSHSLGEPRERFDTEDYSFVYISVAGTSWTSYNLVQAYDDGTYIDYGNIISARNRSPINLAIDKEEEKVTFRHIDRYTGEWFTDYEIDLRKGTIEQVKNND